MYVHRSASGVIAWAPAKLNLFFEVLGKRDDGFHEIETLMVPISLYDRLSFRVEPSGEIDVDCRWALADGKRVANRRELGELPSGHDNIAARAVQLLRRRAGISVGASLQIVKRIPAAAGLGGGSSDAAAALIAANIGWGLDWPGSALVGLAAELGSDVPFFLGQGAAICRGRGERIEPIAGLGALHFVVVRPPEGLSTSGVYANCRPAPQPCRVEPLVAALRSGDTGRAGRLLHNRLEPAAESLSTWIGRLRGEFARLDCLSARMSGSGTSYFGMCRHAHHARRVAGRLRARGVGQVYAVRS
jgi:4-diphosphocytidyl-2-C-methyl-D-erythritol kinase